MLADYTFRRYKDRYFVTNTGLTSITYSLGKQEDCSDYESVLTGSVGVDEEVELTIKLDGDYRLELSDGEETATHNFRHYLRLQKSLILNMKKALCGDTCGCLECDEISIDECVSYQALFNQLLGYQHLIRPMTQDYCGSSCLFDKYIYEALNLNRCSIADDLNVQMANGLLSGKIVASRRTMMYIVAIYYTTFYFYERLLAIDTEEKDYIDEKFRWTVVQPCIKKLGVNINEIRDLYTEVSTECNEAPTVGNVTRSFADEDYSNDLRTYQFITSDFTSGYSDPNGDVPNTVKIINNVFRGQLQYDGVDIDGEDFEFHIDDVDKLTYKFTIQETQEQFDIIFFQINDTNPTPKYSNMGKITFAVTQYVNLAPTEVGDNAFTLANRAIKTFTLADFTTTTTPAYADPESDPVDALRIDTLPDAGTLLLVNTPCTVGQIVTVTQINAGQFKYQSPDQNNSASTDWDFSLRDTGSMTFTS